VAAITAIGRRVLAAQVYLPRIGCGLVGGRWERIGPLIVAELCQRVTAVTADDRYA
jgi:hypothetical protein